MTRCWNDQKVLSESRWIITFKDNLGIRLRVQFSTIDDPLGSKMIGKLLGIGDIVPMRQKDAADPTQILQLSDERLDELRRVDQPVSIRMMEEVTVAAVGFGELKPQ